MHQARKPTDGHRCEHDPSKHVFVYAAAEDEHPGTLRMPLDVDHAATRWAGSSVSNSIVIIAVLPPGAPSLFLNASVLLELQHAYRRLTIS